MKAMAYFSTPIGELLEETPEGFLISRDCVIGRTGWQTYKVGDLPKASADRFGVDTSNPNSNIEVYRPPEEVFNPDTLASFEGKPVTDNHPPDFVDPGNFNEFARGHVQNVRRGKEPLESGEWPMIADIHITAEPLLSKVRNKIVSELSCGYDYSVGREGDKLLQCDITGNHVAVVPKGRAGSEARINDSVDPDPTATSAITEVTPITVVKEKTPVSNWRKKLLGLGLRAAAADSEMKPEDIADAAAAIHEEPPEQTGEDKHGKDKPGEQEPVMNEDRKRLHDAMDRFKDGKATDADLEELKSNFKDFINEEEKEPEHTEDEMAPLEAALSEDGEEEEECAECGDSPCSCEDSEEEEEIGEVTEPSGKEEMKGEDRARAADGAKAALLAMRPVIARCKDTKVHAAFNAAIRIVNGKSKASDSSYGKFGKVASARAAAPRDARARAADAQEDPNKKLQAAYDAAAKGGK